MYYCSHYTHAVALCVLTMLCWGSWGNTQKLAGKTWRYEFFYWDYVLGLVLFALAAGLTLGSAGELDTWSFTSNLAAAPAKTLLGPLAAGIIFNAANILLVASIAIAGMAVAFPVGVGLALVGGTAANHLVDHKGNPALIWCGLILIVASILCDAFAFRIRNRACQAKSDPKALRKGLLLAAAAGILMSFFSPLVNRAIDLEFASAAPKEGLLTPYVAFFVFTLGVLGSNFVWNTLAMRFPVSGEPARGRDYFRGRATTHLVGLLGGGIWACGTLISFVAAGTAGAAIAYALGQGATLVAALWGILVWREFKGAPRVCAWLNVSMVLLFAAGLYLIVRAGQC